MLVQVGVICHKPYDNPLLERCLDSLVRVPAGIAYNLATQFSEGTYAENWNRLMAKCSAEFVCVLEDDTAALRPNWLRSLLDTAAVYRDAAIVMPINADDPITVNPGFRQWIDKTMAVLPTYGFCNLVRRNIGLHADENLTYFNDMDLALQARRLGWNCYVNGHVWMLHEGGFPERHSSTANLASEKVNKIKDKDRAYLDKKWGRHPSLDTAHWLGEAGWQIQQHTGPLDVVVDIGAFTGEFAIAALKKGAQRIICFEPNPENYRTLCKNLSLFPDAPVETHCLAVTASGEEIKFWLSNARSSMCLVDRLYELETGPYQEMILPSIRLSEVIKRYGPIDYLKIDIEGGEYNLFDQKDDELAELMSEGVRFLEVEPHKFEGQDGPKELLGAYRYLGDAGARESLVTWFRKIGFRDDPLTYKSLYQGSFMSFNHNMERRAA